MEKIGKLILNHLRNNEHSQFMNDVDGLIAIYGAAELGVEGQYADFEIALMAERTAMRIELGSIKTRDIKQLDKLRDSTWSAISARVKATLRSPFKQEAESAMVIWYTLKQYGNIYLLSFNEATATFSNLIKDLNSPDNMAHLQTIGITGWVDELKSQSKQFEVLFDERNSEMANRISGDVRAIRKQIDPLYKQIIEKINASLVLEIAQPAAFNFAGSLNQKIKYYKTTLAARYTRSKSTEKAKKGMPVETLTNVEPDA